MAREMPLTLAVIARLRYLQFHWSDIDNMHLDFLVNAEPYQLVYSALDRARKETGYASVVRSYPYRWLTLPEKQAGVENPQYVKFRDAYARAYSELAARL